LKQQISTPVIAGVVIVVLLIIGYFAYRVTTGGSGVTAPGNVGGKDMQIKMFRAHAGPNAPLPKGLK
jgi:hypothetical protein